MGRGGGCNGGRRKAKKAKVGADTKIAHVTLD